MQKTIFATRLEATNWRSTVRKAALIAFFISSVIVAFSQTAPSLYNGWPTSYSFTEWAATEPAGTYPANMIFWRTGTQDPSLAATPNANYTAAYNGGSGSRLNGRGTGGVSFTNTGSSGNNGMAVIGLNTTGRSSVIVNSNIVMLGNGTGNLTYNATSQNREYRVRLQYYVGSTSNRNLG